MVLEKTLESPLDSKEIKPGNPKGNQPCIFIGKTVAEAEALILWPPDANSQFTGKDPDAGKDGGQRRRRWRSIQWLDGIIYSIDMSLSKFRNAEGQGSLACYSPWSCREKDTTERLNSNYPVERGLQGSQASVVAAPGC